MAEVRSVVDLEDESAVEEQVRKLQSLEHALESEHSELINISQLAVELVSRIEPSNGSDANVVRSQIDDITQRWDGLVSNIDEHTRALVKSEKTEGDHLQRSNSVDEKIEEQLVADEKLEKITDDDDAKHTETSPIRTQLSTVQYSKSEQMPSTSSSSKKIVDLSPLEQFINHVDDVMDGLSKLSEWTISFQSEWNADNVREMVRTCQTKLKEIKEKESRVKQLETELEQLKTANISDEDLSRANDYFEDFTHEWSRIVSKISDTLNSLSTYNRTLQEKDTNSIIAHLDDFLTSAANIMETCIQTPFEEREKRLKNLQAEILSHSKSLTFLEQNHSDKESVEQLKAKMSEVTDTARRMRETCSILLRTEAYLRSTTSSIGDLEGLRRDLESCEVEYLLVDCPYTLHSRTPSLFPV
ncbi:hypothetical protein AB6A40_009076 [Gnathostoma spinigerum]|uniref:Uncharacterized protein n=1 Tax=Gnathostoma spinigerum TaxID=75299 RepID=A0ABD6EZX1_9BILA